MGILSSLFGKSNVQPVKYQERDNDPRYSATMPDVIGLNGSPAENMSANFEFHFQPHDVPRSPGPAYRSSMLQFQEYPETVIEGKGGIAYARSFQAFEPLMGTVQSTPVVSGTSGIQHDVLYSQPLADTSSNTVAG